MPNGFVFLTVLSACAAAATAGTASSRIRFDTSDLEKYRGSITLWKPDERAIYIGSNVHDYSGFFSAGEYTILQGHLHKLVHNGEAWLLGSEDSSFYAYISRGKDDINFIDPLNLQRVDVVNSVIESSGGRKPVPRPWEFLHAVARYIATRSTDVKIELLMGGVSISPGTMSNTSWTALARYTGWDDVHPSGPAASATGGEIIDSHINHTGASHDQEQLLGGYLYNPRDHKFTIGGSVHHGPIDGPVSLIPGANEIGVEANAEWRSKILKHISSMLSKYSEWISIQRPDRDEIRRSSDKLKTKLYAIGHQKESNDIKSPFGVDASEISGIFDRIREGTKQLREQVNSQGKTIITSNTGVFNARAETILGAAAVGYTGYVRYGPVPGATFAAAFFCLIEESAVTANLVVILCASVYFLKRYPVAGALGLFYGFGLYEGVFK